MTIEKRTFLLDANVFIEAKRRYYAFDVCPGFWDCLNSLHATGNLFSIDHVKKELENGGDDLAQWLSEMMPAEFFISTDKNSIIRCYGEIVSWVYKQEQFWEAAKAEFSDKADGWLIACTRAMEMVLVTHEVYTSDARKKVPIPNICQKFNVPYVDTFEMLRELGVSFHWNQVD